MAVGIVTFTSDYGWEDEFVGVCHGVMLSISPEVRIVDLHHSIARHDVRHGAVVLEQSVPYMPDAVHLAVVDPSVGSERRAIAVETAEGAVLVGPDNGLLLPAADACGGIAAAYSLEEARFLLSPVSRTFQGRDVFAPASAHLASGVPAAELGPPAEVSSLVRLEIPKAWEHDDHLHAEVLQVDRFGNLQLNFDGARLKKIGLSESSSLEVRLEGHRLQIHHGATFADVPAGDFVLVEDSYKHLSLAINKGDAGAKLRAASGSTVIVGPINT
ncbi:MAG: SAM-dependent chlorinase/fluorinase [Actinobacteria bacterium]|nr:SAM-dependent chlorinase/fluorinase [Actinomycetota bacterium]